MRETKIVLISLMVISSFSGFDCNYAGPFLFWGTDNLNDLKIPALQSINDNVLRKVYSDSAVILVFLKNSSMQLNHDNFPKLSEIVESSQWLFSHQKTLSTDPMENVNAEVIRLTGPADQQDVEIATLFKEAQQTYSPNKVLGILASITDTYGHSIQKREAESVVSTSMEPPTTPINAIEPIEENFVYVAKGKGILYTTEAPILKIGSNESGEVKEYELKSHSLVTADERENLFKLIVNFIDSDIGKLPIKFLFRISSGSWEMAEVEYESIILNIVGIAPSAPLGFSYKCSNKFFYKKGNISLLLQNIQVQPLMKQLMNGETQFSKAYDCVGFMSAPILSGIFVTFLMAFGMTIAITAILDIKPPNRFENRCSKQLTFTVQD
ncbi:unnamed protein product [Diamesa serratosioi]